MLAIEYAMNCVQIQVQYGGEKFIFNIREISTAYLVYEAVKQYRNMCEEALFHEYTAVLDLLKPALDKLVLAHELKNLSYTLGYFDEEDSESRPPDSC